jgi:hypothetical protein
MRVTARVFDQDAPLRLVVERSLESAHVEIELHGGAV